MTTPNDTQPPNFASPTPDVMIDIALLRKLRQEQSECTERNLRLFEENLRLKRQLAESQRELDEARTTVAALKQLLDEACKAYDELQWRKPNDEQ